jgi:hypothetical protein
LNDIRISAKINKNAPADCAFENWNIHIVFLPLTIAHPTKPYGAAKRPSLSVKFKSTTMIGHNSEDLARQ